MEHDIDWAGVVIHHTNNHLVTVQIAWPEGFYHMYMEPDVSPVYWAQGIPLSSMFAKINVSGRLVGRMDQYSPAPDWAAQQEQIRNLPPRMIGDGR